MASSALAASSGGAGTEPGAGGGGSASGAPAQPQPADQTVSVTGGGITLSTLSDGVVGHGLSFAGQASGAVAGERVEIQRRGAATHWRWSNTAHGNTDGAGNFQAYWPANHPGRYAIRAVLFSGSAHAASSSPALTVTVFKLSLATIYGPGFWGHRTACGQILRRDTLGVANRTLPCGTRVALLYQGRILVVPVIDRGPYSNGAQWDLTEATASALQISGTETVGATAVPGH